MADTPTPRRTRKPSPRQIESTKATLIQISEWADIDGRDRDDIGRVVYVLNQIEDGEITAHEEGTF